MDCALSLKRLKEREAAFMLALIHAGKLFTLLPFPFSPLKARLCNVSLIKTRIVEFVQNQIK